MAGSIRVECSKSLAEIFSGACRGLDCLDYITVLIVAAIAGPIGRKLIAKATGLGEKRVRRIAERLRTLGLVRSSKAGIEATIDGAYCLERDGRTIALVACSREAARQILEHIIELRDRIVIALASPELLEVIGYVDSESVEVPYLDAENLKLYSKLLQPLGKLEGCTNGCIAAVYKQSRCYRCCASLLHALAASG